jgi:hypothetical protein
VAQGHLADGTPLADGYRIGPELGAGGLWTTPTDLAKVWVELGRARNGQDAVLLTPALARTMTTAVAPTLSAGSGYGLGVFVRDVDGQVTLGHSGDNPGYHGFATAHGGSGVGVVVMTNGDGGRYLVSAVWDADRDASDGGSDACPAQAS